LLLRAQRATASLDRRTHDHLTARRTGDGTADQQQVARAVDFDDAQVSTYLRLNNIFDHSYVGSVIVNESNGRYYEPAPTRTIFGGIQINWKH